MKNILKNTWAVLDQKERWRFGMLSMLDIAINIADILSLALLLWIIQFYIQPAASHLSFLPGWLANKKSVSFIAVFFVFFGLKNALAFFIARSQFIFIGKVAVRISKRNLQNYQQARFNEFINVDSSVHIRRIAFQPLEFCQYMLSGIQQIITQACLILLTIVAIIFFNAQLFLLLLCILLPPVVIVFYFIRKRIASSKLNIRYSNEKSFQYLLDALKGYVEGNIYNRNDFFLQRFIKYRRKFSAYLFNLLSLQTIPSRIIEIFAVLGLFILIAIAKWPGSQNSAVLITIGAFMAAAYKIIPGVVKIINISGQIKAYEFSVTADLIQNKIFENKDKEKNTDIAIHSVEFRNINFGYPELPVLNEFNLAIKKGDFLGITGRSGKGKTTILNLLLGFLRPVKGEIFINNIPVDENAIKKHWPSITYVRQQAFFIHDTILQNITLQENVYDKDKLQCALKISGLNELIKNSSEGLNKIITENGKNISGGQQQRIALARALYKNADLILLDEPFSELDESSEALLLQHFRELSKTGKLIIIITHNKKALSYCTKIISLDEQ